MKLLKLLFCSSLFTLSFSLCYAQGSWTPVKNLAPDSAGGGMVLLTDGTVMVKGYSNGGWATPDSNWELLTPDSHGSYVNGTWSQLPNMHYSRFAFASQVLPNGNVYEGGSEHGTGGPTAELFNTITHSWTVIPGIPATGGYNIFDGNSEILYDGTVLQGCQLGPTYYNMSYCGDNLIYNPVTDSITVGAISFGSHDESSWVKLRDSSVINVDMATTNSERYIPQLKRWVHDATVPVSLYEPGYDETGAGFMLPNRNLFFIGDVNYTAIYTPSGDTLPGTWITGPALPTKGTHGQVGSWDGAAAMMDNGKILCVLSATSSEDPPFFFYEFDYTNNTFTEVPAPEGGDSINAPLNMTTMLDLPDGTVLFANTDSNRFYVYTPSGTPLAEGKPVIDSIDNSNCPNYKITGKLFNGISEGAAYGDDWQMSTNYPIVRLTDGSNVYYARTTNWNRIGALMTDSLEDTAYFTLPAGLPAGSYSLVVVANGNPSNPTLFTPCVSTNTVAVTKPAAISVYPNPFSTTTTITVESGKWKVESYLEVDDVTGRILKSLEFTGAQYELNAQDLAKGLYFIRVFDKDKNVVGTTKIVVQ
jgi:hypothetical protein